MRIFGCLFLLFSLTCTPAIAAKRLALVVGNNAYEEVTPLKKARGDALAISRQISDQGFEVFTLLDASRRQMAREFARFTGALEPGDTAMLFFAGHGVEINGENYLLPVDIAAPDSGGEDFVKLESFALSDLLDGVRATGARTTLVFLDACRDNPFASTNGRSIGRTRGLARIAAPQGTFVVYSAGAGQQALDALGKNDPDENSVFTRLLLPKLSTSGLELRKLISELRVEVRNLARTQSHDQFPAYYDELLGDFYFAGEGVPKTANLAQVPDEDEPKPVPSSAIATIHRDFEIARNMGTVTALQEFVNRYQEQDDYVVLLARNMIKERADGAGSGDGNTTTEPVDEPVQHVNRRSIIRQSQARLNAIGCNVGTADGVAGRKTRDAFVRFIELSGADLSLADLGSSAALQYLNDSSGIVCVRPAKTSQIVQVTEATLRSGDPVERVWNFKASCPFFIKTTGSVQVSHIDGNMFRVKTRDSLGQTSIGELHTIGRDFSGSEKWDSGLKTTFSGQISEDGSSATLKTSVGCKVVWKPQ